MAWCVVAALCLCAMVWHERWRARRSRMHTHTPTCVPSHTPGVGTCVGVRRARAIVALVCAAMSPRTRRSMAAHINARHANVCGGHVCARTNSQKTCFVCRFMRAHTWPPHFKKQTHQAACNATWPSARCLTDGLRLRCLWSSDRRLKYWPCSMALSMGPRERDARLR